MAFGCHWVEGSREELAEANGFTDVTTELDQVHSTSTQCFEETLAADRAGDIASFSASVLIAWGEAGRISPYGQVDAILRGAPADFFAEALAG